MLLLGNAIVLAGCVLMVAFKLMIVGLQVLWTVYDFYHQNYVGFAFDLFTIASTTIGIFMIRKDAKQ